MDQINLLTAPKSMEMTVVAILASQGMRRRLLNLGIRPGDRIVKYTAATWGPVLVRNVTQQASKIAIGRGLAGKIIVEI